jgi:hypothetical protein
MAGSTGMKCPFCKRTVVVGNFSGKFIQHENRLGFRCQGTGTDPLPIEPRKTAARAAGSSSTGSTGTGSAVKKAPATPTHGAVTVRKVFVDPDELQKRQQKIEELRLERAAAARERNEVHLSYFDDPRAK